MALFNKKFCDICGGSMGLIIDNKAADGNYCHACARKLSPYFKGGRNATLRQIQEQLAYRETNRQQLNIFNPSRTLGFKTKVYLDPGHNCFVVSKSSNYKNDNADIINMSQVTGAKSETKEHKTELYTKDASGNRVSYNPRQYEYSYEIFVTINVNSPYFNEIKFEVTDTPVKNKGSQEFMRYQNEADLIVAAVTGRQAVGMNAGGVGAVAGAVGQAVAGAAGIAGLAGIAGALLGNQNNQQQNMMNNQGFAQQGMMNNQAYGQQGMMNNQAYGQQGMMNNQAYGQQGMMNNQGFAQQGMMGNQAYGQQGMMGNQAFGQQNMMGNTAFGQQGMMNNQGFAQWSCPNCGMTNTGAVCQNCGFQKQF